MDWLLGLGKKKSDEPEPGQDAGAAPRDAHGRAAAPVETPATASEEPVTRMKKGAYLALKVVVLVTGEDAPAHPFVPDAEQVVREVFASGRSTLHPDWQIAVEKVSETEAPGEWD
jgi:hypothetical protein